MEAHNSMNWLAHLYLSEPTAAFRLGNLLPDLAPPSVLRELPEAFQAGIARHRQIDAFTDTHRLFRQSVRRLPLPHRRYGGVLVDIFYDHFLAADWSLFSDLPLQDFAQEVYAAFDEHRDRFPEKVRTRFEWIERVDLLCSYREIDGVAAALSGVSGRLRRHLDLTEAVAVLESRYDQLQADFHRFFPDLQAHVGQ